jgi:hypothetical protein
MYNTEYVCVEFLDRQADILQRWAFTNGKKVLLKEDLATHLQKSTQHSLEDINLLMKHMEHSGRIVCLEDEDPKNNLVKFIDKTAEDATLSFTQKEKAEFFLKSRIQKIEVRTAKLQ